MSAPFEQLAAVEAWRSERMIPMASVKSLGAAALAEGIANNAIPIAHGVTEVDDLPDDDAQIGVLRRDFLVSEERAGKLSGAWGRHPLLGRMYLPAYRAGTERVAELRRRYPARQLLPALYGCGGLVDVTTIEQALGKPTESRKIK
jgi:hypothetical protein